MNDLEFLKTIAICITPVGSRITCNPAPTNTDADYLVLISPSAWQILKYQMDLFSFKQDGQEHYAGQINTNFEFKSFSRNEINLIITSSLEFYDRFIAASSIAKRFNLLKKEDRIALFQACIYGNKCEQFQSI